MRMYTRWAERRKYKVEVMDMADGEEAGIKGATLQIKGHNAYGKLKTGGRMLNHTITRSDDGERAIYKNSFINRYVFPDGELSGPGHIMSAFNNAGFEIRHEENLREHYALTLKHWCENLENHWDEAVAEAGLGTARVWRLYMAASRMGFDINNIQLHQMLAVKNDARGRSGMPLRPDFTTNVEILV
jgi:cyclopropane-fatty-acyl-phospholipid synthase